MVSRTLDKKVLRDLWALRGQALAIAVVIAGGVATFVMCLSVLQTLEETRAGFYRDYRFAEVFAALKRAPDGLGERLREIPGVRWATTRVVAPLTLEVEGFSEPITGELVSLPENDPAALNQVYLRAGRRVSPDRDDEVLISDGFAEAHGLGPGDRLRCVVNGHRKDLRVVGVALAPDYVFQLGPGTLLPDFSRYGVLWMAREPLSVAFDMDGAFNRVSLTLTPRAEVQEVIDRVDEALAPYGGTGAFEREDQLSHRYLNEEFKQLRLMARMFPAIFLGVAAFLLNVVVARLVSTQREQIAALKAFGYSNLEVGLHYAKLVVVIVLLGTALGVAFGGWLGKGMSDMYIEFYRFPSLTYMLRPWVVLSAAAISLASALVGTLVAVRRAVQLPPAEAMRPEAPARYRVSLVERLGLRRLLPQSARMILRGLERRPVNSSLSVIGIGFACALLMVSSFFSDATDYMIYVQYNLVQREDLTVNFVEPTSRKALFELQGLPGVWRGEPFRSAGVILRSEQRSYRTGLQGVAPGNELHQLLDAKLRPFQPPAEGLLLSDAVAKILRVQPGDRIVVEVLEGARPKVEVEVAALVREFVGTSCYMSLDALNRLLGEGHAITGAHLTYDPRYEAEIFSALHDRPRVAGILSVGSSLATLRETMQRQLLTFAFFSTLLASSIAFGVVYNAARIALSERSRELASLRVLGFTRWEISTILLGELGLLTALAIPVGWGIGLGLCYGMVQTWQNDLFRIPFVVETQTFTFAAVVVLVSAAISAFVVRRRLDRLDLVSVLKTRE
ncbi:MAG: FtsX-like permease family protein [Planctomycetes bacterium]|nr:FtsX-like permease family protein [Planctomycetota bacterium]